MSDQKAPESPRKDRRIEIKSFAEIKEKAIEEPLSGDLDNQEVYGQKELQSARHELENIKDQKEQMIEEARAMIAREKQEWEQTKRTLTKQAHEEGYHVGFTTGEQAGNHQYQELLRQANQIVESANSDYYSKLEKSEAAIVDLAIHVSQKVINRELQDDSSVLLGIVRTAIKEIKDQPTITIHVHPDYYGIVFQQKEELARLVHGDTVLTVYANNELAPDGCFIEHPLGKIDASVDTQLQQLREVLHEAAMETES